LIQVRWDALFLSALQTREPVEVSLTPPKQPVLTEQSAGLLHKLLMHHTASAFCRTLGPDPVFFLEQDTVSACKPVDTAFWEKIRPVWSEGALSELWADVMVRNGAFSPMRMALLPGDPWLLLRWRIAADHIRSGAALWFPIESSYTTACERYCATVPFFLRAEITRSIAALLDRHHKMWEESVKEEQTLATLLDQTGKWQYPWADIDSWLNRIHGWAGPEALSYEDGDFLLDILRSSGALRKREVLQRYYNEHGLAFGNVHASDS
jgi:hypothetical protein